MMMKNKNSSTSSITEFSSSQHKPEILNRTREYDGFFKIDRFDVKVMHPGDDSFVTLRRYVFERGDAVAVLLIDLEKRQFALVRQFRMPPLCRNENGWLLETVAGSMLPDESPQDVALKEVFEETGQHVSEITEAGSFYLSPGGSSERCFLFFAYLDIEVLDCAEGGEINTDERTFVEIFDFDSVQKLISNGFIVDAKTIIALQKMIAEHY